jgi:hypothetical protein
MKFFLYENVCLRFSVVYFINLYVCTGPIIKTLVPGRGFTTPRGAAASTVGNAALKYNLVSNLLSCVHLHTSAVSN